MRIVKTDADRILHFPAYVQMTPELESSIVYLESDTIEITDEECHIIWRDFKWTDYQDYKFPFAQYLNELMSLRDLK